MTKDEAFTLWASKHDMTAGLPWEPSHDLLKTVFSAGWDAHNESLKQAVMQLDGAMLTRGTVTAEEIYDAYPRKVGRAAALKAIKGAINKVPTHTLLQATRDYATAVKTWAPTARYTACGSDTVPHPATWFNQERWTDDRSEWVKNAAKHTPSQFGRTYS